MICKHFAEGQVLFRERDPADCVFRLLSGAVDILRELVPRRIGRIGTAGRFSFLISFSGATNSPQRSFPGVGYLVQDALHARGLR